MVSSLLFLLALAPQKVEDYFPTAVGSKWTYEETSDVKLQYVDEVLPVFAILGTPTIPIQTSRKLEILGTNFYRIEGDTVYLFAIDKDAALPDPQPFLKVGAKEVTWTYKGQTPYGQALLPIELKATSTPGGKVSVLGEDRDALKLVMNSKIQEAGGLMTITCRSTATFAKGIGMVEMSETISYTKTKSSRKVKLVAFEPAK